MIPDIAPTRTSSQQTVTNLLPEFRETCFLVSHFLSNRQCDELVATRKRKGYGKASTHYPTDYRNNERAVVDHAALATQLFEQVRAFVPETIESSSRNPSERGRWQLLGINERLRFCRYKAGQFFGRHLDGVHHRSAQVQSKLTFMIYLNDAAEFEGGRTHFYPSRLAERPVASYYPQKGDLIVFDHNLWHEGEMVHAGEKYILRSDLLYEQVEAPRISAPGKYQSGHLGYIWKLLQFDADRLLSAGRDRQIRVWNRLGEEVQKLSGHRNSISDLVKLDAHTLASCSRDSSIVLWKLNAKGQFERNLRIELPQITGLALMKLDADHFACAGSDGNIRIYTRHGSLLRVIAAHDNWVWGLALLQQETLLSISQDGHLKCWNWSTGSLLTDSALAHAPLTAVCVHGQHIYAGDQKGRVHHWTIREGQIPAYCGRFQAHQGIIRSVAAVDDSGLVTGSEDSYVRLWSVANWEIKAEYKHQNFVQSVLYDTKKQQLVSSAYDGSILEWPLEETD